MNRALTLSDLAVSDLTAEIAIELPKAWNERFHSKASFKRVNKTPAETTETPETPEPTTNPTDNTGGNTEPTNGGESGGPVNP